jgi:hypothetical protein
MRGTGGLARGSRRASHPPDLVVGGAAAQGQFNLSFDSPHALARFTSAGAWDTSFGTRGLVTTTLVSDTTNVYSYVNGVLNAGLNLARTAISCVA